MMLPAVNSVSIEHRAECGRFCVLMPVIRPSARMILYRVSDANIIYRLARSSRGIIKITELAAY
jgi:hypothetical protein